MKIEVKKLEIKKDHRGWLMEILRAKDLKNRKFGQIFVTVALPGQTKGGHYHKRKTEWYCVIKGQGLVSIKDLITGKTKEIEIGEKNMALVKIPPHTLHLVKNTGCEEMYLLIYIDEEFNPLNPDTFTAE